MNRRTLLKAGLCATALGVFSAPAAFAQTSDAEVLSLLSAYLNGLTTMQGRFVQQAPDGRLAEGTFYLRRPGRLRFEYDEPYPTLVVADGTWAAIVNKKTRTVDRLPLSSTPLYLLLKDGVNLASEGAVQSIERGVGLVKVTAVDPQRPGEGAVQMIFSTNPIELQQWIVTDAQGKTSVIRMRDTQRGVAIDPTKFVIEDPNLQ